MATVRSTRTPCMLVSKAGRALTSSSPIYPLSRACISTITAARAHMYNESSAESSNTTANNMNSVLHSPSRSASPPSRSLETSRNFRSREYASVKIGQQPTLSGSTSLGRPIAKPGEMVPMEGAELSRLPRAVQAVYLRPLRRKATYGVPSCDLQMRSYSIRNLEFFADFALRAAYYLNLPASGPVPLPRLVKRWTVPRSNFVFKKSQENFERVTVRRLIQIKDGHPETVEVWLAFLRKHAYHGVGMKANIWDYSAPNAKVLAKDGAVSASTASRSRRRPFTRKPSTTVSKSTTGVEETKVASKTNEAREKAKESMAQTV